MTPFEDGRNCQPPASLGSDVAFAQPQGGGEQMSSSAEFLVFLAILPALWQVPRMFLPVRMDAAGTHFTGLYRRYSVRTHTGYVSDIQTHTDKFQTGHVTASTSGMMTGSMFSGSTTFYDGRVTHKRQHTKFFLTDGSGSAQPVDTVNVNPSIGEGHLVSVAWLIHNGKTGNAFLIYNHTTRRVRAEPVRLGWLSAPYGLSKMVLPLPAAYMILLCVLLVTIPLQLAFVFAAKWQAGRFLKHGSEPLTAAMRRRAETMPSHLVNLNAIPAQPGPSEVIDLAAQMKEISALHDSGALTDEEFQAAKTRLLERT